MRGFLWLLLLVLQLAAGAAPSAASERVIVAFGDSLTAGFGVPADQTYPALLGERLRREGYAYKVVNAGVSGDTTAGGLRRVDWALRLKPEIVILELGVNDALRGQNLVSVRANLDQLVTRFQAAGARVLVAGMRLPPNYGTPYADDFYRLFSEVARARNAPYLPFFLEGVGAIPRLTRRMGFTRPRRGMCSWSSTCGSFWCRCCENSPAPERLSADWGSAGAISGPPH